MLNTIGSWVKRSDINFNRISKVSVDGREITYIEGACRKLLSEYKGWLLRLLRERGIYDLRFPYGAFVPDA